MSIKTKIAIIGCGYIGSELTKILYNTNQYEIWVLKRKDAKFPDKINVVRSNLENKKPFELFPKNYFDYVVYAISSDQRTETAYYNAYIHYLEKTLNYFIELHPNIKRFIFISSTSVFHQNNGEWVNENSECKPYHYSGKIMLEAEQTLLSMNIKTTSVRFSGIYGPRRDRMIKLVKSGKGYSNQPELYSNRIHKIDGAGILKHLMHLDSQNKKIEPLYLATDSHPEKIHKITDWLSTQLNTSINKINPSFSFRSNKKCSNQRIIETGYQFKFSSYKEGYQHIIREYIKLNKIPIRPPAK